jgi:hypothetical protein
MNILKILKSKTVIGLGIALICMCILKHFFIYNVTSSIQTGLYMRVFPTFPVKKGDVVVEFVPYGKGIKAKDEKRLRETGIISDGMIRKIKTVAGVSGDVITVRGENVFINDTDYGQILAFEGKDYLTEFKNKYDGYVLKQNEYIALSKRTGSLDGRYEDGVRNINDIKGKYVLVLRGYNDLGYCFEKKVKNDRRCDMAYKYGKNPLKAVTLDNKGRVVEKKNEKD